MNEKKITWLTTPWNQDEFDPPKPNPIFRKVVVLDEESNRASLEICGLGHYELYINGARVGDCQLEPAFTDYDKRVFFSTYNIQPYLRKGENVFAIYLGRGRFNMMTESVWAFEKAPWRGPCRFFMTGEISSNNETISLDSTNWKCLEGPIFRDCMYAGEGFDARLEPEGWLKPNFDDSDWKDAVEIEGPKGRLLASDFDPIRIVDEVPVLKTVYADEERLVFEFPDMLAGNVRIRVNEPSGTRIQIRYTEICEGTQPVCRQGHVEGEYFQEDEFICRGGGEETWHPRFSYKGFRYIELRGFTQEILPEQIVALDMHQDFPSRGAFFCSNELINRIHRVSRRALLNNSHHVMTDTPTYEKNGWTGDAQLTSTMGLYNFKMETFYRKFLADMRDSQSGSGEIAPIVPTSGWGLSDHPNGEGKPFRGHMPAWDGALFIIPWEIYQFTGNTEILSENYDSMKKYMDFIEGRSKDNLLRKGLGDWLPPSGFGAEVERPVLSSTSWYFRLSGILSQVAGLLGEANYEERMNKLAQDIYRSFNQAFLNDACDAYETGHEKAYRQTPAIQALAFGLVPEKHRQAVSQRLIDEIKKPGTPRLDTGILGTRLILDVLTDLGEVDLAYDLLSGEEYPSWGHWFAEGRVSLGEAWEMSSRSWTHHMFGSVDAWLYQYLAGIRPEKPGFSEVSIHPHIPTKLREVRAQVETQRGRVSSSWKKDQDALMFECEIPKGCKGTLNLPKELGGVRPLKEGKSTYRVPSSS